MQEIKTALREVFITALRLDINPADIGKADLIAQLGIDSIVLMEIITQVENRFGIIIEDEDVSPALVDSLDTFAAYIAKKQSQ
jgi:acyl carrier protein